MNDRSFERDIKNLPKQIKSQVKDVILKVRGSTLLSDFNPTKMEDAKNAFRIRCGNYRIGFYLEGDIIVFQEYFIEKRFTENFPRK